jgi:hypothetical protein
MGYIQGRRSSPALPIVLGAVGLYAAWSSVNHYAQKGRAWAFARRMAGPKGIINLGASGSAQLPGPFVGNVAGSSETALNVDREPSSLPGFVQLNLDSYPWPFEPKQFGVAFASHVLEHLTIPTAALEEMQRVADIVVVAIPHPWSVVSMLNPLHKHHFTLGQITWMKAQGILVYY